MFSTSPIVLIWRRHVVVFCRHLRIDMFKAVGCLVSSLSGTLVVGCLRKSQNPRPAPYERIINSKQHKQKHKHANTPTHTVLDNLDTQIFVAPSSFLPASSLSLERHTPQFTRRAQPAGNVLLNGGSRLHSSSTKFKICTCKIGLGGRLVFFCSGCVKYFLRLASHSKNHVNWPFPGVH